MKHPYWCTGYSTGFAVIVAYADNVFQIYDNWPEATDLEVEECDSYTFTDRFPKPEWFKEECQ